MNFFLIEILSVIIYFSFRLYFFANNYFIFSYNNGKLDEYIKINNLHNAPSSLGKSKIKNINSLNFLNIISPSKYKQAFFILLITIVFVALNVAFKYKYIFSNFIYFEILNKKIDIVSLFSDKYIIIRNIYFIIYIICTYDFIYNIFSSKFLYKVYLFFSKFKNIKKDTYKEELLNNEIILGKKDEKIIYINKEGLYQNILITGSIGSGKTSAAITNILDGLLKNNLSGLIIDIKGNYVDTVKKVASKYNRDEDIIEISLESNVKYNPLNNCFSDIELANMLKKVILLMSNNNTSDAFWLDKVENYLRDFICLIRIYNENINFYEIHKLVTDENYLIHKIELVKEKMLNNEFSDEILFKLKNSINNIKKEFLELDTRTLNIIKAEITRLTSIFLSDYRLYEKFCFDSDEIDFFNKIIVLSINIGENSNLLKIISTYLKLDFQKSVLSRNLKTSPSKIKYDNEFINSTFFICDEFQEICNKEDANFFSLSREYKCINVVSMQSYSSLINALNDESAAKVIIQNLVNKIWFRNDDMYTVNEVIKQIGKELKSYEVKNVSENGTNARFNMINKSFVDYKTGITKGYTYNQVLENKINEEYFSTKLKTFEAVCMLSTGISVEYVDKVVFKRWEC